MSSLKKYKVSPFSNMKWEVVSSEDGNKDDKFSPLSLSVIEDDLVKKNVDSLFEEFKEGKRNKTFYTLKDGKEGEGIQGAESEDFEALRLKEFEKKLAESYQKGKEDGIKEGIDKVNKEKEEEFKKEISRFNEIIEALPKEIDNFYNNVQKESVKLSLNIASKILDTFIEIKPDYIVNILKKSIESLGGARPIRIRLSPVDLEYVEIVGVPVELSKEELAIEYVADDGIKSGCVVETDFGEVNLELDNMFDKLSREILDLIK